MERTSERAEKKKERREGSGGELSKKAFFPGESRRRSWKRFLKKKKALSGDLPGWEDPSSKTHPSARAQVHSTLTRWVLRGRTSLGRVDTTKKPDSTVWVLPEGRRGKSFTVRSPNTVITEKKTPPPPQGPLGKAQRKTGRATASPEKHSFGKPNRESSPNVGGGALLRTPSSGSKQEKRFWGAISYRDLLPGKPLLKKTNRF